MFFGIKSERSIASWLGPLVVSTLAHGGLGFAVVALTVDRRHPKETRPGIDVTLRPPPLPPPPPAAQAVPVSRKARPTTLTIPARVLVQPDRMPVPEPPESTTTGYPDDGEQGVEGGVIGGVVGGVLDGAGGQLAAPEGPALLLGAGMTRPMPRGECSPSGARSRPITPTQARQMSIIGTVLVEYTVHPDGSVGEISMRNNGPPVLFEAVKK